MDIVQHRIVLPDREVLLLACEHVRPESVEQIRLVLNEERPDHVCVELDTQRLSWLEDRAAWEGLDLVEVMRRKQMPLLSSHLALRIFQKRLARFTTLEPGDEMWSAVEAARKINADVVLADRDMLITGVRAWRNTSLLNRPKLLLALTFGTMQRKRKDRQGHKRNEKVAERVIERLARQLPAVKNVLVDERDFYMAHMIRSTSAKRIVAVVGPAHIHGIFEQLRSELSSDQAKAANEHMSDICMIPTKSRLASVMPWLISAVLIGLFIAGFSLGDRKQLLDAAQIWIICHSVIAGLFTLAAFGHFWTVLSVAISSPIVSLNPLVGAGMVGAAVQIFTAPPSIREIETVGDDITHLSGWWKNRLARIVLILILANLGSTIGTVLAVWLLSKDFVGF